MPKKKITLTKDELYDLAKKYHISDEDMASIIADPIPKDERGPMASVQSKDDPLFIRYLYTFVSDEQAALPSDLMIRTLFEEISDFEALKKSGSNYGYTSSSDSDFYLRSGHWVPENCSIYSFLREFSCSVFKGMSDAAVDTYKIVHPDEYAKEVRDCLECLRPYESRRNQRIKTPYMASAKTVRLRTDIQDVTRCNVNGTLRQLVRRAETRIMTFEEALESQVFAIGHPTYLMSNCSFPKKLDIFRIRDVTEHAFGPETKAENKLPSLLTETEESFIARNKKSDGYRRTCGNLNYNFDIFNDEYPLEMWRFSQLTKSQSLADKDYEVTYAFIKKMFKRVEKTTKVAVFERTIYDN